MEDETECLETLKGWRSTVFGKNFCSAKDIEARMRYESPYDKNSHDYSKSKSCVSECMICEYHNECESGCCAALEIDGVKRCRDKCYDEFDQPIFSNSNESVAPNEKCDELEGELVAMIVGSVITLYICLICCLVSPLCFGACCLLSAFNKQKPIDEKIHQAHQKAKSRIEEAKQG